MVLAEAEVVRRIFRLYVDHGWGGTWMVSLLNADGTPTNTGLVGRWSIVVIAKILRNPA